MSCSCTHLHSHAHTHIHTPILTHTHTHTQTPIHKPPHTHTNTLHWSSPWTSNRTSTGSNFPLQTLLCYLRCLKITWAYLKLYTFTFAAVGYQALLCSVSRTSTIYPISYFLRSSIQKLACLCNPD